MKKSLLTFMLLTLASGTSVIGQELKSTYIEWPNSSSFPTYVKQWKPGTPLFEDENFFISRVKTKEFIPRNSVLQIFPELNNSTDKKLLFWVPVGDTNRKGVHTDALPNGVYDSEVFSLWSYVTHYGDWTSPHGWVPGGFADAAHKHGVAVSGVASIPNASLSVGSDWYTTLSESGMLDAATAGEFLRYHGVNGLGYNSEYSISSKIQENLRKFHIALNKYMADKDSKFEIITYDGVSDQGSIAFSERLCNTNKLNFGSAEEKASNFFLNYNWNNPSYIAESERNCEALGRPMSDLYAGMNMQGGCKTATEWQRHMTTNYSIGLWGAHDFNYLWAPRSQAGNSNEAKQATYQRLQEWWFTNGKRNPACKMEVPEMKSLAATESFFGISRMMSAHSTLGWDLSDEPFITYFNLGNGKFFKYKGERVKDSEWYNIGIQDYMPTWRWWWSDSFIGNEPENVPATGLDATFTWEDAYFGGSSLMISGTTADEYLHLFRTNFKLERNDVITIRYKVIAGSANMNLALSVASKETTIVREGNFSLLTTDFDDIEDKWIEKRFTISGPLATSFTANPLAMIALHFTDASNLKLLIGEISIRRGKTSTPVAPTITLAKTLAFNHYGVDGKVIFNVPNNKPASEPCYNSDVNVAVFKLWSQQEGEEPILNCATSSWAGLIYAAPMDANGVKRIRFGVQAVSMDFESESSITWSDYMDAGEYEVSHDIAISQTTIKPGEEFEISYIDQNHPIVTWEILDSEMKQVATAEGIAIRCEGLDKLDNYHVVVDKGGENEKIYYNYFSITAWDKGALPKIQTLGINGEDIDEEVFITDELSASLTYTGREANGESSQALGINEHFVGANIGQLGIQPLSSFAFGAWFNFKVPTGNSRLVAIENRNGSWPLNNWGWLWSELGTDGSWYLTFRISPQANQPDAFQYKFTEKLPFNAWFHLAISCEYNLGKFRARVFLNGEELIPSSITMKTVTLTSPNPDNWWYGCNSYGIATSDWIALGGGAGSSPTYNDGAIDEFVVWDGPITAEDATKAMNGLDATSLPGNVVSYWSFEGKAEDDNTFLGVGSKPGVAASCFEPVASGAEGSGKQTPTFPIYTAGAPSLSQNGFIVKTTPTWSGTGVTLTEAEGCDTEGSAKATLRKDGDYKVTLSLENVLGKDVRTYPVIRVTTESAITDTEDAEIVLITTDDAVVIDFADEGDYCISIFDVNGRLVANATRSIDSIGGKVIVGLNRTGVYMLNITRNGYTLRTVKIAK